jgi:hypothetical protein
VSYNSRVGQAAAASTVPAVKKAVTSKESIATAFWRGILGIGSLIEVTHPSSSATTILRGHVLLSLSLDSLKTFWFSPWYIDSFRKCKINCKDELLSSLFF